MTKNNCRLQVRYEDGVLEAVLGGELDHHGAVAVRTLIDAEICRLCPKKTVLDLSELDFMDSSGLGLLMGRYALIKRMGGEMVLLSPTPAVLRIVRLAGMERMLKIETT